MRIMVMGNSWPSQRRHSNRRQPMACTPHGAASGGDKDERKATQLAKTYSYAGCLRCCVADTPRTPLAASTRHRWRRPIVPTAGGVWGGK
jgi:hypothetical protein